MEYPLDIHESIFKQPDEKHYKCMFLTTEFLISHNQEKWDEIVAWCRDQFGPPAYFVYGTIAGTTWCLESSAILFTDFAQATAFKIRWM